MLTNTKVNLALHPFEVDKSSTGLPSWGQGGRVHLWRVAGNCEISYAHCVSVFRTFLKHFYTLQSCRARSFKDSMGGITTERIRPGAPAVRTKFCIC